MTEQSGNTHQDIILALKSYEAKLAELMKESSHHRVSLAEANLLALIEQGPSSIVKLAEQRDVSKQAVQSQVQSLAKRGYVSLDRDRSDGRVRLVSLTRAGAELVTGYSEAQSKAEALLEDKLGPQRLKNFRNMLGQVVAATA